MISTESPTGNVVTRFAPSPTGYLHLGHAHAALFAEAKALESGGRFLLRIEDIDQGRARPEFEEAIYEDLEWLGLAWESPVRRQSEHFQDYAAALARLDGLGLIYPCFCTRKEIMAEIESAGVAPHLGSHGAVKGPDKSHGSIKGPDISQGAAKGPGKSHGAAKGPDGPLYPGTCRGLASGARQRKLLMGAGYALRLDMAAAVRRAGPLSWRDRERGEIAARPEIFGDVVLARKDTPASYHLACTWDDHLQGVTLVTRGEDLLQATHVHRLLQALLGLATPDYHHHALLTDEAGRRLAKRDQALTIRALRQAGKSAAEVRRLAGF